MPLAALSGKHFERPATLGRWIASDRRLRPTLTARVGLAGPGAACRPSSLGPTWRASLLKLAHYLTACGSLQAVR